jgi:hypothetical protein
MARKVLKRFGWPVERCDRAAATIALRKVPVRADIIDGQTHRSGTRSTP